jgi:hypothetical protein
MQMKRHWPLAFLGLPLWAEVLIYIAFIVLIVGTLIIWLLWNWCEKYLAPTSPTDTNVVTEVTVVTQVINTVRASQPKAAVHSQTNLFTMQYGMFTFDGVEVFPWMVQGIMFQAGTNGESDIISNDGQGNEIVALTESGQLFIVSVTTNGVITPPITTYTEVIQRSADLENWFPVYTNNSMVVNGVYTYTDQSNTSEAFYRTVY